MRKLILTGILQLVLFLGFSQELSYYLPDSVRYNPAIPKPKDVIYHNVGEWHVTHDRLVNYMNALADAAPDRIKLVNMGFTYETRPQVLLIITSPANHKKLEAIRQQHLQLSDPSRSDQLDIEHMPAVVWIGHSIHGNEPSGANAALLSAYYLAAAKGASIDNLLENLVILFDPSFNPDGLQRFSTWVNQHRSRRLVTDPASREFNEVWPGGRFNHYWFDLNRDWLPGVHPESQHRLQWFQDWHPNILTDHHEQGSNASFFFQPGVPSRVNPLTPDINQELTARMAQFHAAFLDRLGSLYFTRENYDDFYYGKGSTYPDVQGCVGILFEQASSRGHAQETANGILRFPFTIRNQFVTTLSTLESARAMRKEFLNYQRDFYKMAFKEGSNSPVRGYIYGDARDRTRTTLFTEMLKRHRIEVQTLNADISISGEKFEKGKAFVVPTAQPQYRLIRSIFDKVHEFKDSLFYDITSWTMPLAFGLPYAQLDAGTMKKLTVGKSPAGEPGPQGRWVGADNGYALLFEWDEYYAPRLLYALQDAGIKVKVATEPFSLPTAEGLHYFSYGTISIPMQLQTIDRELVLKLARETAAPLGVDLYMVNTGYSPEGIDLGSSKLMNVDKPEIAMMVGTGVNATDAGEIWHLLDQRFDIPSTHLEIPMFNRVDDHRYTTLIMPGGYYPSLDKNKLRNWIEEGGTLIACEEAVSWLIRNGILKGDFKSTGAGFDSTASRAYADRDQVRGAQRMAGAIFRADIDTTHPLFFGYRRPYIDLFKSNSVFLKIPSNPYAVPAAYHGSPLQSGYITGRNYTAVKQSAAVLVQSTGRGKIIAIVDNPNFRAFWLGGSKLMLNAIFFGPDIDGSSASAGLEAAVD